MSFVSYKTYPLLNILIYSSIILYPLSTYCSKENKKGDVQKQILKVKCIFFEYYVALQLKKVWFYKIQDKPVVSI